MFVIYVDKTRACQSGNMPINKYCYDGVGSKIFLYFSQEID